MEEINFKNLLKKILLFNLLILFSQIFFIKTSWAFSSSSRGVMKAEVSEQTINTNTINGDLIFDNLNVANGTSNSAGGDLFVINKKESGGGFAAREKFLHISSKANTIVNIAYGYNALSEVDNADNMKGYAIVVLRNSNNQEITAKIKIDRIIVAFDANGKADLKVVSEFNMKSEQPKGTYRGYYHMIIAY